MGAVVSHIDYRRGRSPDALADLQDGCAACVLTDPPYGTGKAGANYGRRREGRVTSIANDVDLSELAATAPLIARVLAADGTVLVFCAPQQRRHVEALLEGAGLSPLHSLPWDKGAPGISYRVRYAYEDVVLAAHPGYDPWEARETLIVPVRHPRVQETEHPNEKPVGLLRIYTRWACPSGGLIVDPFAGIASSAVAAHAEGCDWIGAEMDEQWWGIAERRIADALERPHPDLTQYGLFTETKEIA